VVFAVAATTSRWPLRISSAVGLALATHLVMVMVMVMVREFLLTKTQLNRARTGADRSDKPGPQRAA
jgi:hypothetical protein